MIGVTEGMSSEAVQLALIDQGYGEDNPDIIDTHPSVVKRQKEERVREMLRDLRAKDMRGIGRAVVAHSTPVGTEGEPIYVSRDGVVLTGEEANRLAAGEP